MESMVRLIHVDGIYDRGGTKQNQAEAEAVVAEIVRRYKNESLRNDSIGVVTFNSLQQNLIDDLIIEAFHNDPELEDINNSHSEPLFIKNLENVQGDERDVILFSVGYGPDKSGKVTMNFGPLNREGGWRRLNVAISRARKEMTVFSSLRPEDIDLSKTASAGISGLKGFLEFAQRGKNAVAAKASAMNSSDHGLEETIAEKLREKGFNVRCGVGCSEYKIDIGIVDDNDPTKYILGIICDGIVYKNSDTARDRNILQPSVLTSLGWKLHRVWSLDWLDNPERELNKIIAAVGHAKHDRTMPASEEKKTVKEELKFEKSEETELKNMRVYITASRESSFLRRTTEQPNDFYLADTEKDILRYIKYVLEIEAPISRDLLRKRVTSAWGIQRVGPKAEELIDRLVAQTDAYTIDHGDNAFIWGRDMSPVVYNQYRIPETDDTKRAITDICPEEMANAIKDILSDQISMSKEDLIRETARVFGYVRLGSQIEQSVEHGIDTACMRGFALMTEDGKISCV